MGLRYLIIGSGNDDNGIVYVGGISNYVFDVIGVVRVVDVGVVFVFG